MATQNKVTRYQYVMSDARLRRLFDNVLRRIPRGDLQGVTFNETEWRAAKRCAGLHVVPTRAQWESDALQMFVLAHMLAHESLKQAQEVNDALEINERAVNRVVKRWGFEVEQRAYLKEFPQLRAVWRSR